jgi:hypothetical protein
MGHRGLGDSGHLVVEDEVAAGARQCEVATTAVVEADAVGIEKRCGVAAGGLRALPREVEPDVHAVRPRLAGTTLLRRDDDD